MDWHTATLDDEAPKMYRTCPVSVPNLSRKRKVATEGRKLGQDTCCYRECNRISSVSKPTTPVFIARADPQLHAACQREFARLGTTQTKVINMAMERWLHGSKPEIPVAPAQLIGKPRKRKDIWLNKGLLEAVEKRAAADGLPVATWIASLIQSALMAEHVVLDREVLALEAQVRELSAVGRNLNQIAHHMNKEARLGIPPKIERLEMKLLKEIVLEINKLRGESRNLIRARRKAWGLKDERT